MIKNQRFNGILSIGYLEFLANVPHLLLQRFQNSQPMGIVGNKDRRLFLQQHQQIIGPVDQRNTFYLKSDKEVYPYKSIGLLFFDGNPKGTGTASVLYDQKTKSCKFLITCAHNFIFYDEDQGSIINHNNSQDKKRYKFRIKSQQTTMEQLSNTGPYLGIKQVHIPKDYTKELETFKNLKKGNTDQQYKYYSHSQKHQNIYNHQYFDIALVELENPLEVGTGFQLREQAKQWKEINLQNVETAGYPYAQAKFGSKYGNLYFEKVGFHEQAPEDCIKLIESQAEGKGLAIIKHEISTLAGNSGSPIFQRVGESCYLFGIHTTGVFRSQNAIYNFGTYLYGERIDNWLASILKSTFVSN